MSLRNGLGDEASLEDVKFRYDHLESYFKAVESNDSESRDKRFEKEKLDGVVLELDELLTKRSVIVHEILPYKIRQLKSNISDYLAQNYGSQN